MEERRGPKVPSHVISTNPIWIKLTKNEEGLRERSNDLFLLIIPTTLQ